MLTTFMGLTSVYAGALTTPPLRSSPAFNRRAVKAVLRCEFVTMLAVGLSRIFQKWIGPYTPSMGHVIVLSPKQRLQMVWITAVLRTCRQMMQIVIAGKRADEQLPKEPVYSVYAPRERHFAVSMRIFAASPEPASRRVKNNTLRHSEAHRVIAGAAKATMIYQSVGATFT